ncbi:MAG: hypothetical protein AABY40_04260 [Nanoarchaeota archaeon]
MQLEERVMVTLYQVESSGNKIEHDSPTIGVYQEYGGWSKKDEIYASLELAQRRQNALVKSYLKTEEGYRIHDSKANNAKGPRVIHLGDIVTDIYVKVNVLEVDKTEIVIDGKKRHYYQGSNILFE